MNKRSSTPCKYVPDYLDIRRLGLYAKLLKLFIVSNRYLKPGQSPSTRIAEVYVARTPWCCSTVRRCELPVSNSTSRLATAASNSLTGYQKTQPPLIKRHKRRWDPSWQFLEADTRTRPESTSVRIRFQNGTGWQICNSPLPGFFLPSFLPFIFFKENK